MRTRFRHTEAVGRSWTRNEQRLHVCAASHQGIRRFEVLAQFSLLDKRARNYAGVLQASGLAECDVEKGIAEITRPGLVLAAERRMLPRGRGDYQQIGCRGGRRKHCWPRG